MYPGKAWEQISIYDFNQGFGFPISEDNPWIQLSKKIPWDEAEEIYVEKFTKGSSPGMRNVALPFRTALGVLSLSDRGDGEDHPRDPLPAIIPGFLALRGQAAV